MAAPKWRDQQVEELCQAILLLENTDECCRFLEDLCTIGEIKALAGRLAVAKMLDQGLSYQEIRGRTGMSSATISRISRFLNYGADGYRLVLDRLRAGQKLGK